MQRFGNELRGFGANPCDETAATNPRCGTDEKRQKAAENAVNPKKPTSGGHEIRTRNRLPGITFPV